MQITVKSAKQNLGIETAPHIRDNMSTPRIMLYVIIALVPAFITTIFFFGFGVLWQFVIALISSLICEVIVAFLRSYKLKHHLADHAYIVTALLLALTLPPLMPWYFTATASAFAILVVKHCFGGLGQNIFNPAMAGFIFLMISAPSSFYQTYVTPSAYAYKIASLDASASIILEGRDPQELRMQLKANLENADIITGATYLESIKTAKKSGIDDQINNIDFLGHDFNAYFYLALAYILGGIFLIATKVILFQMPLSFLITIFIGGYIWHNLAPNVSLSGIEHLLCGGTMLAAFFIITDPVTNAGTSKGRIVFSIFCALLILLIRVQGSYSDSVAFAVLLANATAPLIDVLTKRRSFGIGYKKGGLQ